MGYRVESAFNGAVLYPLNRVRSTQAKYDQGDDDQRCEHIGFNKSLKTTMFVSRKWSFNLKPTHPGGPMGARAMKSVMLIQTTPTLAIFFCDSTFSLLFIVCPAIDEDWYFCHLSIVFQKSLCTTIEAI